MLIVEKYIKYNEDKKITKNSPPEIMGNIYVLLPSRFFSYITFHPVSILYVTYYLPAVGH